MKIGFWTQSAALAVLLVVLAPMAGAADHPKAEATAFVGYRMGGQFDLNNPPEGVSKSVDLQNATSWGIDLGLYRDSNSFYEFLFSQQSAGLDTHDPALKGADVKTTYWQVGGTIFYPQDTWFEPYLSLTVGVAQFDVSGAGGGSETKFAGTLGGGFRFPVNENVGVVLGARGYLTAVSSDTDFFCSGGGGSASCLFHTTGSTFFQGEVLLGVTGKF
jgi:opacity protein-like surface antigen